MTWRVRYRDRRRSWLGLLLLRVEAENQQRAASKARAQLTAKGINPVIVGIAAN